jgi:hypothetical protein
MDMGLQKDNVIILPNTEKLQPGAEEILRQQMSVLPGVTSASITTSIPTGRTFGDFYEPEAENGIEPLTKDMATQFLYGR